MYALMSLINLMPLEAVNSSRPMNTEKRVALFTFCKAIVGWLKAVVMVGLFVWIFLLFLQDSSTMRRDGIGFSNGSRCKYVERCQYTRPAEVPV